jgi:AcrR family transcriptional regulator
MTSGSKPLVDEKKGKRTARRLLEAAAHLFASQGYEATSLRQIAEAVGIREPGLYNHFGGKRALYEAVLERSLRPVLERLDEYLERARNLHDRAGLPAFMTDLLLEHSQAAGLLQQAMQSDSGSVGHSMVQEWLDGLLRRGMRNLQAMEPPGKPDRATLAISVIAIFNVTAGYFLSQPSFAALSTGNLTDPENIARQKRLLHRIIRAMLVS